MTLTPGTKLGSYEIAAPLGAGGMGEVYRARDTALKREVAVKVLPRAYSSDPERLQRFRQEAEASAALNHPNILSIYHIGEQDGFPYIVTELLHGETLREKLRGGGLPISRVIEYGLQIASGLAMAHQKGIIHRDLKPDNLFVTRDNRVKILDFGLAKLTRPETDSDPNTATVDRATDPGKVLGTVGYMAPEQLRAQRTDARADIFALGAILYEMLSGRRAFARASAADTYSAILKEDPPSLATVEAKVPPALERVVRRCLEKAPEHRFQSALDLGFALEAISVSSDSGIELKRAVPVKASTGPIWWLAAVAVVLLGCFVMWQQTQRPQARVEDVVQLTDDGEPKAMFSSLASDASRVYFNEGQTGSWRIAQVSVKGGQTAPIAMSVTDPILVGMSPDSSALLMLAGSGNIRAGLMTMFSSSLPLWLLPLPAGDAVRLGDLESRSVDYFPDGQHIVYCKGAGIYISDRDGANAHKIADVPGMSAGAWPTVSPDGMRIRFTVYGPHLTASLWETEASGASLRQILKDWQGSDSECCGRWTADGKYFVFQSLHERRWDLWALAGAKGILHRSREIPAQLTNGPLSYYQPLPARNGEAIFAIGSKEKGQLIRYDARRKEFVPFLEGISATDVVTSRDGHWVIYLSYPDHTLWRSRLDGSARLQLTSSHLQATFPHISPDGTRVAFGSWNKKETNAYIVSMQGGAPQKILDYAESPDWSPDGSNLVFERDLEVATVDLRSGQVTKIPGGGTGPLWPTQDSLVAASPDGGKLLRFDLKARKWFELADGPFINWFPSSDGKYLYGEKSIASGSSVIRIRLTDGHIEQVAEIAGLRRVDDEQWGTWLGVTNDGSLLLTRNLGTQEIYSIKVHWP